MKNRKARGALDLDRNEYQIDFDEAHIPVRVEQKTRLETHRMIEEMMIAANVAVAQFLQKRTSPCLFRVHDRPDPQRAEELLKTAKKMGFNMPKKMGNHPRDYQHLLEQARNHESYELLAHAMLRTQSQACYHLENIGHFGLSLQHYCHFTSPIRRYADLCIHRQLCFWIDGSERGEVNDDIGLHISQTERVAQKCEFAAFDRHAAFILKDKIDTKLEGIIAHISASGLFIFLEDVSIEGFMPARFLLPASHRYGKMRAETWLKSRYQALEKITVILENADPLKGEILLRADSSAREPASRRREAAHKRSVKKKTKATRQHQRKKA